MLTSLTLPPPRPPLDPPFPAFHHWLLEREAASTDLPAFRNLAQLLHVAGVIFYSRIEIFDNDLFRTDPTLTPSHLMLSFWKKDIHRSSQTILHKDWFCWREEKGVGAIRDRSSYQIGWIFGKVPKGQRGGGSHFQSQNLYCRFWELWTRLFEHEIDTKD